MIAGYQPEQLIISSMPILPPSMTIMSLLLQQKEAAKSLYETTWKRFSSGLTTMSEVINASIMLLESKLALSSDADTTVSGYEAALKRARELESDASRMAELEIISKYDLT
jgi:hypothetical protein